MPILDHYAEFSPPQIAIIGVSIIQTNSNILNSCSPPTSYPIFTALCVEVEQFTMEEKEIQLLTKQWYLGLTWQRIRTIPWIQGDYYPLTNIYTNFTLVEQDKQGNKLDKLKYYEEIFHLENAIEQHVPLSKTYIAEYIRGVPRCLKTNVFSSMQCYVTSEKKQAGQRILLNSHPGFGKTLFVHKVASDWAHGNLSMFDFIFAIKVKYMIPNETIEQAIVHQIKMLKDNNIAYSAITNILKSNKFQVLLILDGLDEINMDKYQHVKTLIVGETFVKCWLLVTTQPHLVSRMRHRFNSIFYIKGFSDEAVWSLVAKITKETTNMSANEIYKKAHLIHLRTKSNDTYYSSPFLINAAIHMALDRDSNYTVLTRNISGFFYFYKAFNLMAGMDADLSNPHAWLRSTDIDDIIIISEFYAQLVRFILKTNQVTKHLTDMEIHNAIQYAMKLAIQVPIYQLIPIETEELSDPNVVKAKDKRRGF